MPVVGYTIKSVVAERKKSITNRLDVSSTPKVTSVEEKDIEALGKQPALVIGFEFESNYKPDVASIRIVGDLVYTAKNNKDILKTWKKDGKLQDEVEMEVKNFLFKKCLTLGIYIADEMQLPPPLGFPTVVPKEEQPKYIG